MPDIRSKTSPLIASLLFLLSGAVGLVYEIVWVKLLSLQFGNSAWAQATVIAAFMAGLSVGSWWGGRKADLFKNPLKIYGWLEIGIALYGPLSLLIFNNLHILIGPLYRALEGQGSSFVLVQFLLVFLILIVPTIFMGASLPVLVVGFSRKGRFENLVGLLYGINTVGAALGVVLAGFVLLPQFGIRETVLIACLAGLFIGGIAWCLGTNARFFVPAQEKAEMENESLVVGFVWHPIFLAVFISGGTGMLYEISWSRLLAPVVGSSIYAFSIMLATFLVGIGLGGILVSKQWISVKNYPSSLGFLIAFTSLTAGTSLFVVNHLPAAYLRLAEWVHPHVTLFFFAQAALAGSLMILPTLAMGAALPLAVAGFGLQTGRKGRALGSLYALNTAGSILGSLSTGFVLLPLLGVRDTILVGVVLGFMTASILFFQDSPFLRNNRFLWIVMGGTLSLLALVFTPNTDLRHLHVGKFRSILQEGQDRTLRAADLLFAKEGPTSTVTVYRDTTDTYLKVNGKTDATMNGDLLTQYMLGHLPLFLAAKVETACIIGLGSGATVRAVAAHPVSVIDVIEIEPAVAQASRYFEPINDAVLTDPRVRLHYEDGRTFLQYRPDRYDAIISEPSNPWIAGVSSLFSREFYRVVQKRLSPNGVFCQWIQCYELSSETLNGMLRTLHESFSHVMIFRNGGDFICVASREPFEAQGDKIKKRFEEPAVQSTLNRIKISNPFELLVSYYASFPEDEALFPSGKVNTDNNLWLEYRAPIEMHLGLGPTLPEASSQRLLRQLKPVFAGSLQEDQVVQGLAEAMLKHHPSQSVQIAEMKTFTKNTAIRQRLDAMAQRAADRNVQLKHLYGSIVKADGIIGQNKADEAIRILKDIIAVDEDNAQAYRILGRAYSMKNNLTQAIRYFGLAIKKAPQDYVAHADLGTIWIMKGDKTRAERSLRTALDLNPFYHFTRAHLVLLYTAQGREREAEELLLEAKRLSSKKEWDHLSKMMKDLSHFKPYRDIHQSLLNSGSLSMAGGN